MARVSVPSSIRTFTALFALVGMFQILHALHECDYSKNIARFKPTYQSSTEHAGLSYRAVDGDLNPRFWDGGSCTHTDGKGFAWWAVDLLEYACVHHVIITNRGDCCSDRLTNFYVSMSNTDPRTEAPEPGASDTNCIYYIGTPTTTNSTLKCVNKLACGRYLVVQLSSENTKLSLCEVQVFKGPCSASGSGRSADDADLEIDEFNSTNATLISSDEINQTDLSAVTPA